MEAVGEMIQEESSVSVSASVINSSQNEVNIEEEKDMSMGESVPNFESDNQPFVKVKKQAKS